MVYSKLVGLQYKIIHMHGCDNVEADVLSCLLSSLLDTRCCTCPNAHKPRRMRLCKVINRTLKLKSY